MGVDASGIRKVFDLAAKMPDGVVLLADRWFPRQQSDNPPTVLIRTPYGRHIM